MTKKAQYLSFILAPVSLGELIDKITILEIKQIHLTRLKDISKLDDFNQVVDWENSSFYQASNY